MNGIVINIDPVIFHLGEFEFRWYSLAILLGVIAAIWITARLAKGKGIPVDEVYSLALWVIIGGIAGARLFHVVDQWGYYMANPAQIVQLQQGGLAIWGALGGGGVALLLCARLRHLPLARLADAVVPGLLVAQIIGRFGCIVNGDAYGGFTSLPWGFIYVNPDAMIPPNLLGLPTHPYPVYEMLWNTGVLLAVLWIGRRFRKDGLVFWSYLPLYSLGRFVLTFVRQESATLWGLQQAQIIALLAFVASLVLVVYFIKAKRLPKEAA